MNPGSKVLFIDVVRAVASVMVVAIHVSDHAVNHFLQPQYSDLLYWWMSAFVNACSRAAVPLFVLVSGYLLLHRYAQATPWEWVRKRLTRILIPLVAWIAVYFLWRQFTTPHGYTGMEMLRDAVRGDPYYHLWFLYMLLGLYLATPILATYLRAADQLDIKYFVVLWLLSTAAPPLVSRALYINSFGLSVTVVSGFVGYFMLGHWMRNMVLNTRQGVLVAGVVLLSIVLTTLGTYVLTSRAEGKVDELFFSPMSPTVMIATLGLFAIANSIPWASVYESMPLLRMLVEALSAASFFLYLSHPLILDLLRFSGIPYFAADMNPFIGIPLTVAAIVLIAVGIRSALAGLQVFDTKLVFG